MVSKNITILFTSLILCSIIFIYGCTGGGNNISTEVPKIDVHVGYDGLEFEFLDEMPPISLYEGNDFTIGLLLHNKGAYDIRNAHLRITGYQEKYFDLEKDYLEINLDGRSLYNAEGDITYEYIDASSKEIHDLLDNVEFPLTVTACYLYETIASADVCLTTPQNNLFKKDSCTAGVSRLPSGQGGPLGIKSIEDEIIPSKNSLVYSFKIDVGNFGNGDIRIPSAYGKDCVGPVLNASDPNRFKMEVFLGNTKLSCRQDSSKAGSNDYFVLPEKIVSLINENSDDDHRIICEYKSDSDITSYTSKLSIKLYYGYVDSITKQIVMHQYNR